MTEITNIIDRSPVGLRIEFRADPLGLTSAREPPADLQVLSAAGTPTRFDTERPAKPSDWIIFQLVHTGQWLAANLASHGARPKAVKVGRRVLTTSLDDALEQDVASVRERLPARSNSETRPAVELLTGNGAASRKLP